MVIKHTAITTPSKKTFKCAISRLKKFTLIDLEVAAMQALQNDDYLIEDMLRDDIENDLVTKKTNRELSSNILTGPIANSFFYFRITFKVGLDKCFK